MSAATAPGLVRLTALHTRYQVLETVRVPIAVVGTSVFPVLSFLFFVVPQDFAQQPVPATAAAAQLSLFAVMSVCLFSFGVGVAEDRALPWDGYLRTLPAGPVPRLTARLGAGLVLAMVGLVPLVVAAWVLSAATLSPGRLLLTALALAAAGVPLLRIGLTIGVLDAEQGGDRRRAGAAAAAGVRRRALPPARDLPGLARRGVGVAADPGRA